VQALVQPRSRTHPLQNDFSFPVTGARAPPAERLCRVIPKTAPHHALGPRSRRQPRLTVPDNSVKKPIDPALPQEVSDISNSVHLYSPKRRPTNSQGLYPKKVFGNRHTRPPRHNSQRQSKISTRPDPFNGVKHGLQPRTLTMTINDSVTGRVLHHKGGLSIFPVALGPSLGYMGASPGGTGWFAVISADVISWTPTKTRPAAQTAPTVLSGLSLLQGRTYTDDASQFRYAE